MSTILREWKKSLETDLESIIYELKDFIETPAIIILSGDVGVGKTTFTKVFVQQMATHKEAFSPTYSLVNELGNLVHADFYRLNSAEEVIHLELSMYLEDKEYFLVEWGKPYLNEILAETSDDFEVYEIEFEMNEVAEGQSVATRDLKLIHLSS
ncbi:MAG: tRNA (adenosine(37)-N6)-threonylcarbamoyltransferase complex ATPase subunit type 1 TsaE [Halobacteriovoraceae bacterium]|nr:tRNA (adenosine(37)-N6)-threonylcarbamoyltransferase complex ATPase subunit type 1 TsaE [Halobacteriovoraceae bacterium]